MKKRSAPKADNWELFNARLQRQVEAAQRVNARLRAELEAALLAEPEAGRAVEEHIKMRFRRPSRLKRA